MTVVTTRQFWTYASSTREASCGSFRGHRVVGEPEGPLEAGRFKEDFQMPVKVFFDRLPVALAWAKERSVLKREVIGWTT